MTITPALGDFDSVQSLGDSVEELPCGAVCFFGARERERRPRIGLRDGRVRGNIGGREPHL